MPFVIVNRIILKHIAHPLLPEHRKDSLCLTPTEFPVLLCSLSAVVISVLHRFALYKNCPV